jgi:hypothetical protein
VSPIGKGGMGEVWRTRDPRVNRDVAIKVSDARFSERFAREAKAIAALNHPNICQIYDVGPDYIVMEYIDGVPPRAPLAMAEAVGLALGVAAALEEAHAKGVTHRDLKPQFSGDAVRPQAAQFRLGAAQRQFRSGFSRCPDRSLGGGAVMGTVAYVAGAGAGKTDRDILDGSKVFGYD